MLLWIGIPPFLLLSFGLISPVARLDTAHFLSARGQLESVKVLELMATMNGSGPVDLSAMALGIYHGCGNLFHRILRSAWHLGQTDLVRSDPSLQLVAVVVRHWGELLTGVVFYKLFYPTAQMITFLFPAEARWRGHG
eukprot:Skav227338  [mRNA]  locus=scaffold624:103698:112559:- [translate_table: standard]